MPVMAFSANSLSQVREVRQLTRFGSGGEIACQLGQLFRRAGIALGLRGLSGGGQVARDLIGYLRVLRWIRLLELLQSGGKLRERRELAAVGL